MDQISRWPSLLEKLLCAVAFYIDDPMTYFNFCVASRLTNRIANSDLIFIAYKRKQFTQYILLENDVVPVLPNGLVHGIVNMISNDLNPNELQPNELNRNELQRSLRFYHLGYYKYFVSMKFKKTRMANMSFHKQFTKHLCITSLMYVSGICLETVRISTVSGDDFVSDYPIIEEYNNSNQTKKEIEAYRCALCMQFHTFITEYRKNIYIIYSDCVYDIRKYYYLKTPINQFLLSGGFCITPNDHRYTIMKAVIDYSKKLILEKTQLENNQLENSQLKKTHIGKNSIGK